MQYFWIINLLASAIFLYLMLYRSYSRGQFYWNGFVCAINALAVALRFINI